MPSSIQKHRQSAGQYYIKARHYLEPQAAQAQIDAMAQAPNTPRTGNARALWVHPRCAMLLTLMLVANLVASNRSVTDVAPNTRELNSLDHAANQINLANQGGTEPVKLLRDMRSTCNSPAAPSRSSDTLTRQLWRVDAFGHNNELNAFNSPINPSRKTTAHPLEQSSTSRPRQKDSSGPSPKDPFPTQQIARQSPGAVAIAHASQADISQSPKPRDSGELDGTPLKERDTWYDTVSGWLTLPDDPLTMPTAEAASLPRLVSFHLPHGPADALDYAALRHLTQAWEQSGLLSPFQADELALRLHPFLASGFKKETFQEPERALPPGCALIEEIWDLTGHHKAMMIVSPAQLSAIVRAPTQNGNLDMAIVGLPRVVAGMLAQYYERRLTWQYGSICDNMDRTIQWPDVGMSLNAVVSARQAAPVLRLSEMDRGGLGATFIRRNADTGVCQLVRLELGLPDQWKLLRHVTGNRFVTEKTHASDTPILVEVNPRNGKARIAKGYRADAYEPSEFDIDVRDIGQPYVMIQNRLYFLNWQCPQSSMGGNTDAKCIPYAAALDSGRNLGVVYLEPLSRTWHFWYQGAQSVFDRDEVAILRQWAVPLNRDSSYVASERLLPDGARIFAVGSPQPDANLEAFDVVEMAGLVLPAEVKENDDQVWCEVYAMHDPGNQRRRIQWDGWRWCFDRTAPLLNEYVPSATANASTIDAALGPASGNETATVLSVVDNENIAALDTDSAIVNEYEARDEWSAQKIQQDQDYGPDSFGAVSALDQQLRERFPNIHALARSQIRQAIQEKFVLDLDPDQTYLLRFDLAYQDSLAVTGWGHSSQPVEQRSLTACLFTNFPAHDQENPWSLDALAGVYTVGAGQARHFDHTNQVRIRPSDLMQIIWNLDFYTSTKKRLETGWSDPNLQEINNGISLVCNLHHVAANLTSPDVETVLKAASYIASSSSVDTHLLEINGYAATDMLVFTAPATGRTILYMPRHANESARFAAFSDANAMRHWFAVACADADQRQQFARHFSLSDRQDGITYSGIDSWLKTFSEAGAQSYLGKIRAQHPLPSADLFHELALRQKARSISDLDTSIQSDREVTKAIWTDRLDAVTAVLPNPVTPFVSLGLHIDQAVNADTHDARLAGLRATLSDVGNLALMAVLDGVNSLADEGFMLKSSAFHSDVKANLEMLIQADAIEWDGRRWIPERATSSRVSPTLAQRVTSGAYPSGATHDALAMPDPLGLRRAANGSRYIKINGDYIEIKRWGDIPNRYAIGTHENRMILRFADGQFRPETSAERLEVIASRGLSGRSDKKWNIPKTPSELTEAHLTQFEIPPQPIAQVRRVLEGARHLGADEKKLQTELAARAQDLANVADNFFKQLTHPARTVAPSLAATSDPQIFEALFDQKNGIVLGEHHDQIASKQLLIDNMRELKRQGVKTIYLENFHTDIYQTEIDAFLATPDASMPTSLRAHINTLAVGNHIDPAGPYAYRDLLEAARTNGIHVQAIDCAASSYIDTLYRSDLTTPDWVVLRLRRTNYFGSAVIRKHQAMRGNDKWVALVGEAHAYTSEGVPGIAELTDSLSIRIKPDGTRRGIEPGRTHEAQHTRPDYIWWRPDTRVTHLRK